MGERSKDKDCESNTMKQVNRNKRLRKCEIRKRVEKGRIWKRTLRKRKRLRLAKENLIGMEIEHSIKTKRNVKRANGKGKEEEGKREEKDR